MRNSRMKGMVVALALGVSGIAACGGEENEVVETVTSALTASPADPVAFCRASGLHVIIGTSNDDVINGTAAADCIVGLGGQDRINGLGGNDIIFGGDGDDRLDGGDGNDSLSDCVNHNTFTGGAGTNTCQGNRNGGSSSSFTGCQTIVACPGA